MLELRLLSPSLAELATLPSLLPRRARCRRGAKLSEASSARWRAAMPLAQAAHARKAVVAARAGATERHKAFLVDKESEWVL